MAGDFPVDIARQVFTLYDQKDGHSKQEFKFGHSISDTKSVKLHDLIDVGAETLKQKLELINLDNFSEKDGESIRGLLEDLKPVVKSLLQVLAQESSILTKVYLTTKA